MTWTVTTPLAGGEAIYADLRRSRFPVQSVIVQPCVLIGLAEAWEDFATREGLALTVGGY